MNTGNLIIYMILVLSILFIIFIVTIPNSTTPGELIPQFNSTINPPPVFTNAKEPFHPLDEIKPIQEKNGTEEKEEIPDPQITLSFSKSGENQVTQDNGETTHVEKKFITMQQELNQETKQIPVIPNGSFEQVEMKCEKGMCVRNHNPFGTNGTDERPLQYEVLHMKPSSIKLAKHKVIHESNPFNL
jgi:hypothetical protein